ncbi:transcriptional regulator HU subunit alpha [Shimia sp. SK013]|nr:transcriptional regulator HU subunit alpha [Shimia sp. SK013]
MAKTPSSSTRKTMTTRSRSTTTARKSTAATTAATSKAATASTAAVTATVASTASKVPEGVVVAALEKDGSEELRKNELFDAVVERSGIRKKFAKPAIEAALAILGEALEEGRALQLPPLGRVKVQKSKDIDGGVVITTRVRRKETSEAEETKETSGDTVAETSD